MAQSNRKGGSRERGGRERGREREGGERHTHRETERQRETERDRERQRETESIHPSTQQQQQRPHLLVRKPQQHRRHVGSSFNDENWRFCQQIVRMCSCCPMKKDHMFQTHTFFVVSFSRCSLSLFFLSSFSLSLSLSLFLFLLLA